MASKKDKFPPQAAGSGFPQKQSLKICEVKHKKVKSKTVKPFYFFNV